MSHSQLKLEADELRPLYMRYLILQELLPPEVSLYALEIAFKYTKQKILAAYLVWNPYVDWGHPVGVTQLEDRFVNALSLAMHAKVRMCRTASMSDKDARRYNEEAYRLWSQQEKQQLSADELCCFAFVCFSKYYPETQEALLCYETAARLYESRTALLKLAEIYEKGRYKVKQDLAKAVSYYSRAAAAGCPYSSTPLNDILGKRPELRSVSLQ